MRHARVRAPDTGPKVFRRRIPVDYAPFGIEQDGGIFPDRIGKQQFSTGLRLGRIMMGSCSLSACAIFSNLAHESASYR